MGTSVLLETKIGGGAADSGSRERRAAPSATPPGGPRGRSPAAKRRRGRRPPRGCPRRDSRCPPSPTARTESGDSASRSKNRRNGLVEPRRHGTGRARGASRRLLEFAGENRPALVSRVASLAALELTDAERDAPRTAHAHRRALRGAPADSRRASRMSPCLPVPSGRTSRDGSPGALVGRRTLGVSHGHFVVPRAVSRDA